MKRRASAQVTWALALALTGCGQGAVRAPASARVALSPSSWLTERPDLPVDADQALGEALSSRAGVTLSEEARVAAALAAEPAGCSEDPTCLRRVGQAVGASHVVHLRLAALGDTVIVRARLAEVASAGRELARQELVQGATPALLAEAVARLGEELARTIAPEAERPWYRRWWVWALAGAALAGAGSALAVTLATDQGPPGPDVVIRPP